MATGVHPSVTAARMQEVEDFVVFFVFCLFVNTFAFFLPFRLHFVVCLCFCSLFVFLSFVCLSSTLYHLFVFFVFLSTLCRFFSFLSYFAWLINQLLTNSYTAKYNHWFEMIIIFQSDEETGDLSPKVIFQSDEETGKWFHSPVLFLPLIPFNHWPPSYLGIRM